MIAGRHRAAQLKLAKGPEKVTCLGTCFPIFSGNKSRLFCAFECIVIALQEYQEHQMERMK
jgi:hypothetical protein